MVTLIDRNAYAVCNKTKALLVDRGGVLPGHTHLAIHPMLWHVFWEQVPALLGLHFWIIYWLLHTKMRWNDPGSKPWEHKQSLRKFEQFIVV
jgi:hypothetical protein